jgi:hypothetical protein
MIYSNLKILLSVLIISTLLFYSFTQAIAMGEEERSSSPSFASEQENTFNNFLGTFIQALKKSLKDAFQIWQVIHQKILDYWKGFLLPKIQNWLKREASKREPIIREQIQKEKFQLKEEIKELYSKTWQWLKDLIF